jgi:hypothetical protein
MERRLQRCERPTKITGVSPEHYFFGCALGGRIPFSRKYIAASA